VGDFKFDASGDGTPGQDEDLVLVIQKGAMAYGGSPLMAPWPTLSDDDVANVIAYIRTLKQ
jgi:mono/diheme cytochrome c family protein